MKLNFEAWSYGLVAASIGGASTAALSWAGMGAAHAAGIDVPVLNFKALLVVLISGAAPSFFTYLKQSPLPPIVSETTTITTVKETKTVPNEKPAEKTDVIPPHPPTAP